MGRIWDISRTVEDGGLVYPGNPEIRFAPQQRIAEGAGANVSRIEFGSHTGTHVDAPWHFLDDGDTIERMDLRRMIGRARVLHAPYELRVIDAAWLERQDLRGVTRVLLRTRNSALDPRGPFATDYTYLAPEGAELLVRLGVALVGIDYYSVEQFHSGHHRTHRTLIGAGVTIVEALALGDVPAGDYELICLPLKLAGLDAAPARAVLCELQAGG